MDTTTGLINSANALYWILFIGVAIASFIVQASFKRKFEKYSRTRLRNGMTGREVAEKMLADNGIRDVSVISVEGRLTDHYNPANKTVNLSSAVYGECSVAAAAVAAHECGHALQHALGYGPLKMRTALVPPVTIASKWMSILLLGGMLLINIFPGLMLAGIVLFAFTTLFSIVTLPVEINASRRALAWLDSAGITDQYNHRDAKSALKSAAYTYVIAAISSLATLLYYILIFTNRR